MAKSIKKRKEEFLNELKKQKINKKIIDAFFDVKQEYFFDEVYKDKFYTFDVLPIGYGQMSDDPLTLAKMIKYCGIKKNSTVLEIGSGSGYSTAILSQLCKRVVTIEINEKLARAAKTKFDKLGLNNIKIYCGDGFEIDESIGEFDSAIVLAGLKKRPLILLQVLKTDGLVVFPMGPSHQQQIAIMINHPDENVEGLYPVTFKDLCSFLPAIGIYS